MNKFKDKCDNCQQMKVCRGYENKVLCEECIKLEKRKKELKTKGEKYEQTRFIY